MNERDQWTATKAKVKDRIRKDVGQSILDFKPVLFSYERNP